MTRHSRRYGFVLVVELEPNRGSNNRAPVGDLFRTFAKEPANVRARCVGRGEYIRELGSKAQCATYIIDVWNLSKQRAFDCARLVKKTLGQTSYRMLRHTTGQREPGREVEGALD